MRKTILVVNGEKYWQDYLPEYQVVQKKIQQSSWFLKNDQLFVADATSVIQPAGILWRVGAIRPGKTQSIAMNLIALSNVPCVNNVATLKQGYDRLSMLAILKNNEFPVIPFDVVSKATKVKTLKRQFPFVIKAGNFHGGFGKVLVKDETQWQDIKDLLFTVSNYVTAEPYINYAYDIRYLAVGDEVLAMSRKGKYWKANVETTDFEMIVPQQKWIQTIKRLQHLLQADTIAIDILEEKDGTSYIVEYNDIPGLSGFPDYLKQQLVDILKAKMNTK